MIEMIDVLSECGPDFDLAGRQGFSWPISRNTNKDGRFSHKPRHASHFVFSDSFVGFRPFASVFGFSKRNDTRYDTRGNNLRGLLGGPFHRKALAELELVISVIEKRSLRVNPRCVNIWVRP